MSKTKFILFVLATLSGSLWANQEKSDTSRKLCVSVVEQAVLDLPATELNLPTRARKAINRLTNVSGTFSDLKIRDVIQFSPREFLDLRNCGIDTVNAIRFALAQRELSLREDELWFVKFKN